MRLIVEDSGVGIPESHLPHIFDRFYRVPDPNPEKGLGLGLSFVASIVKAHGGDIQVQSESGKGSRFEVILPAAAKPVEVRKCRQPGNSKRTTAENRDWFLPPQPSSTRQTRTRRVLHPSWRRSNGDRVV